jgi:hypothetical protein
MGVVMKAVLAIMRVRARYLALLGLALIQRHLHNHDGGVILELVPVSDGDLLFKITLGHPSESGLEYVDGP